MEVGRGSSDIINLRWILRNIIEANQTNIYICIQEEAFKRLKIIMLITKNVDKDMFKSLESMI